MRCASCASPNASRRAITACIACSARRGISTHQGWRFSAGCCSSQSAILAIKRRPRWCAGSSRPSMSSTIQYSSGSQIACHCRSRLPVRLLPSCTTICACCSSLIALALPNQRSAHGSGCPVCDSTSPISGQPRVCAHSVTFLPSSALMRPATTTPRFCRQKNQSRCFSLSRRGASRSHGLSSCHQSPRRCCQLSPVSSISPYSGSANGQLIWTPPA